MTVEQETLVIRPKGEGGYETFSIRVKEDTVAKIDEIVKQTGRTRNELIGILLNYAVERCKVEKK